MSNKINHINNISSTIYKYIHGINEIDGSILTIIDIGIYYKLSRINHSLVKLMNHKGVNIRYE